jgi:hypothetical protein
MMFNVAFTLSNYLYQVLFQEFVGSIKKVIYKFLSGICSSISLKP